MKRPIYIVVAVASVLFAIDFAGNTAVYGQGNGQLPSTVQLPSFRNFTYRGAVKVPDGGAMHMGGVKSSSEIKTSRGVPGLSGIPGLGRGFRNQGIGRETSSGGLTATAQIIIMEEIEAQMLAEAGMAGNQSAFNAAVHQKAAFLSKHMGRSTLDSSKLKGSSGSNERSSRSQSRNPGR